MRFGRYLKEQEKMKGEDPCWDGYEMVGKKKKNGKEVPNCVPKEESKDKKGVKGKKETLEEDKKGVKDKKETLEEEKKGEYEGRQVTLEKPFRLESGSNKKFGVYVKNDKGNIVKVTFGDPNMEIRRDDDEARKNFRARHNCSDPGPKWKARYWSCYQWREGAKVAD